MTREHTHSTAVLALTIGLLPVLGINLAYIVAVTVDIVPVCIPYLDGCTTISSTGRKPPSSYVFKPAMYLSAVLMMAFWFRSNLWLSGLGERSAWSRWQLVTVGTIGAIALGVYVFYLGTEGSFYRSMRRYGVTVYFGFTYLAQLLLAGHLHRLAVLGNNDTLLGISRLKLILCLVLLAMGLVSIPISHFVADKGNIENVIEWNFALLLHAYFLLSYAALRSSKPV